jgi:heme oxygenase
MSTLKDLTWDAHKRAEQTPIMRQLLKATISDSLYCDLVYTKYEIYRTIEERVQFECVDLYRAQRALNDWQAMGCHMPKMIPSLDTYVNHLRTLSEPVIWGHVYVHYLAPLYGGQIIKKRIAHRFPVSMYEFDQPDAAIAEIRARVHVHMASEANLAFESTTAYYQELHAQHGGIHEPD